jgi:hypothetical protein
MRDGSTAVKETKWLHPVTNIRKKCCFNFHVPKRLSING